MQPTLHMSMAVEYSFTPGPHSKQGVAAEGHPSQRGGGVYMIAPVRGGGGGRISNKLLDAALLNSVNEQNKEDKSCSCFMILGVREEEGEW